MKKQLVISALLTVLALTAPMANAKDDASNNMGTCENGSNLKVRQADLIGKWKETGFYENGKIEPLRFKLDLTHEFRQDCTVISVMNGEASTYQYSIEDGGLVFITPLLGRLVKEFQRVTKDTLIHGGDVFSRIK